MKALLRFITRKSVGLIGIGTLCIFHLNVAQCLANTTTTLRTPTVDDMLSLKYTFMISARPDGKLVAIEEDGGILILSTEQPVRQIKKISGSHPRWSPDGRILAFYEEVAGKTQIAVWRPGSDAVEQITHFPDGISPNPAYGGGSLTNPATDASRWFTWSPNSQQIAFCTRRMVGYEALGAMDTSNVRVFGKDTRDTSSIWEKVFTGDTYSSSDDAKRERAVARHPELGLNKLFVVNIQTKSLRQLTQRDEDFFPTWSPNSDKIAAIVDLSKIVDTDQPGPRRNALVIFDSNTGNEQRIPVPLPVNDPPQWSGDGTMIAMIGQHRLVGFRRIELYSFSTKHWFLVDVPKNMSADEIRWASEGHSLLVKTPDRFVESLWLINPVAKTSSRIDTHNLTLWRFDQAHNGDIFFSASSSTFRTRLFLLRHEKHLLHELYDPNPQLSQLLLETQKRVTWINKAGDSVDGILILPPNYQRGRRYPVLMDVYPIPARDSLELGPSGLGQIEAARGYVVLIPGFRAPHTPAAYSRDANYNEKARGAKGIPILVDDFTSAVNYLVRQGIADPKRIGLFGHSNGGWVVNYLITETNIAKCAVIYSGTSNFTYMQYFSSAWVHEITNGENIYDNFNDFVKMSPLFRMNKVHASLLLIVGDQDWDTWLPEMLMQFTALQRLHKDVTLVRYTDEGHSIAKPENVKDFFHRIDTFFDSHLKP